MILDVARIEEQVSVLGPGVRTVVWVQGCPLRCRHCVAPDMLAFGEGTPTRVDDLAAAIHGFDVDGVTLSGGEPFLQAAALAELIDALRRERPGFSVMCYSGYPLAHLRRRGTVAQHALLARLDILVDGPYLPDNHAALLWRGSSNQHVRLLSDRHKDLITQQDASAGVEFFVRDGSYLWAGVPPSQGFIERVEAGVSAMVATPASGGMR